MHSTGGAAAGAVNPLLGRERECARLAEYLADLRRGRGRVMVLEGPPGIGKTALVRWTVENARGPLVLQTRADETRQMLPYAALRDLLGPHVAHSSALPDSLSDALAPALGRQTATRGDAATASSELVGIAALGLLSAMVERQPVLVVIDDAQWLDPSSAYALAFAAHRIDADAIGFIVAQRADEPSVFQDAGFEAVTLSGISDESAVALIGDRMVPLVARLVVARAAGNPLAITRACEMLTEGQRRGTEPIGDPVPLAGDLVGFREQLEALDPGARCALLVVAIDEGLNLSLINAALGVLGVDDAPAALERAVAGGLLRPTAHGVELAHPLLGSAVLESTDPHDCRAAHRSVAGLLHRADDVERRAWHLADGAAEPDEGIARVLEEAAAFAGMRGDHSARATALERAAELTPARADRVERLMDAGEAFQSAGRGENAVASYDQALALVEDDSARADVYLRRAVPALLVRDTTKACLELEEARERVATFDASRAAVLSVFAALSALSSGLLPRAHESLRRARELDTETALTASPLRVLEAIVGLLEGRAEEAMTALREVGDAIIATNSILTTADILGFVANALTWGDDFDGAEHLLELAIADLRRDAVLGALSYSLMVRAELRWRTGKYFDARADADEARALAGAGRAAIVGYALCALARAEASLGRVDVARDLCAHLLARCEEERVGFLELWGRSALGFVELTADRPEHAIPTLESAAEFSRRQEIRLMAAAPWGPDLVEAYVRCGQLEDATRLVERLERDAGATPTVWAAAALHRCRGLIAEKDFDQHFERALAEHERLPTPFETARTQLCYGERLQRAGRSEEAWRQLDQAVDGFVDVSAASWLDRALRERGSQGGRQPDPARSGLAVLTSKEYQVVRAVVQGASNREVAAAMFVSVRTVESHLANAYRKLGVHTRTELAHLLAPLLDRPS